MNAGSQVDRRVRHPLKSMADRLVHCDPFVAPYPFQDSRLLNFYLLPACLLAAPVLAQTYQRPLVISSPTALTFQDNIVTPYAELPVSPLDMVIKVDPMIPVAYTGIVNSRRGRFELYFKNAAGQQLGVSGTPIPVGVTSYVRRPNTLDFWALAPNSRTDVDPVTRESHLGGAITVVNALTGVPSQVIAVGKGPSGIVFHPSGKVAWVTCRFSKDVYVIDAVQGVVSSVIDLQQFTPHAIDFNAGTNEVLVASLLSGNNTAARSKTNANGLPEIVTHLPTDPNAVTPLPDRDVVVLNVQPGNPLLTTLDTSDLRLATNVMTIQYNLTVDPHRDRAYVVGTEALNHQFVGEKNFVMGAVVENRLAILDYSGAGAPLQTTVNLDSLGMGSIATPTDFLVSPTDPNRGWLIARGSDRVVEFNLSVTPPIAVGAWQVKADPASGFGGTMVGARIGQLDSKGTRLTVWCEIENSFAEIAVHKAPGSNASVFTTPLSYDPMPDEVKAGWGHVSDARTSAGGTSSCNSCHVDGGSDNLAWDLSSWHDPEGTLGSMLTHEEDSKGPMLTQVLFGLPETGPYHWRGEQVDLGQFDGAFSGLLEGPISVKGRKQEMEAYLGFLRHAPNPNLALDRNYASTPSPNGIGDVGQGLTSFLTAPIFSGINASSCVTCHQLPTGTNNALQNLGTIVGPPSSTVQVAQLRGVAQRLDEPFVIGGWFGTRSRNGSGLAHPGNDPSFEAFVDRAVFSGITTGSHGTAISALQQDLVAFLQCFDTGLAPATGYVRILDPHAPRAVTDFMETMAFIRKQTKLAHADFTVVFAVAGAMGGWVPTPMFYEVAGDHFVSAQASQTPIPTSALLALFTGATPPILTILGHPPGAGHRWAIDADDDQILDLDEFNLGTNPFHADSDLDGFPDGYEIIHGADPNVANGTIADVLSPEISGVQGQFATTNTVKLELHTNEPSTVRAFIMVDLGAGPLPLPVGGLASPASGGFTTNHQIVAAGLISGVEIPLFPIPNLLMTVHQIHLVATDPAGNESPASIISVPTGVRTHALRVQSIAAAGGIVIGAGGQPSVSFTVNLAAGTLGEVTLPGTTTTIVPGYGLPTGTPEPVFDVFVQVSYGTQPNGSGSQIVGLTRVLGIGTAGEHVASQSASTGAATFTVTLPASAATDADPRLMVSVDRVVHDSSSGLPQGYSYVETQAYKRHFATLDL